MPRVNKNPGSGKAPHNGPAMGQDYGAGWGGPASGEGRHGAAAGRPAGVTNGKKASLAELCAPHTPTVVETWLAVMNDPNAPPAARIAAGDKIAERAEGKAVATTLNANVNADDALTDAELAREIAKARRALADVGGDSGEADGGE